jgi:tetratricopeptide (TPR) repeat protein
MRFAVFFLSFVISAPAQRFIRAAPATTDQRVAATLAALSATPGQVSDLEELASAYLQKMRETTDFSYVDRAAKLVDQALAKKPGDPEAMVLWNEIELNRHHFAKVVESTRALVKAAPGDVRLWGMMGDSLMEIGDYNAAAEAYEKMLKLRPGLASYNRVSWYRFVTGDADGAIEAMRRAVRVAGAAPENLAWCLVDLGNLYFKTGKLDESERNFQAALEIFPEYHPAFAGLGKVAATRGRTADAIAAYSRAESIVPLPEYAGALRGLYLQDGNTAEGVKQEQLLDVVDRLARANFENTDRTLALILADQDRNLDRALELVRNELAFRRDVYTYDALAWVLFRAGHLDEARNAMRKALAWHTPDPMFRRHADAILGAQ